MIEHAVPRKPNGTFAPGVSGNPAGRPAGGELRELARAKRSDAFAVLVELMASKKVSAAVRLGAAIAVLDRADGRPVTMVAATDSEGRDVPTPDTMTNEELARRVAFIFALGIQRPNDASHVAMRNNPDSAPAVET